MELKSPFTLTFHGNVTKSVGGSIFYDLPNPNLKSKVIECFFKAIVDNTSSTAIEIDFMNSVAEAGMAIFSDDLDICKVYVNNNQSNLLGYKFLKSVSKHYHHTNTSLSISFNPYSLCFCENGALNCSINSKELIVPPG